MAKKIVGSFCEKKIAAKRSFDRRSFRWKRSGKSWVLVGCPRGQYTARTQRCKVGTRAYAVLRATRGACAVGQRVTKR